MTLLVCALSIAMVILQAWLSYRDGFFTQRQIQSQGYRVQGLSFLAHGEMWSDIVLITPVLALIMSHSREWTATSMVACFLAAFSASIFIHREYVKDHLEIPGCHAHDGKLTKAGLVHFVYATFAYAIVLLFYFSSRVTKPEVVAISALLIFHVGFGTFEIPWYLGRPVLNRTNIIELGATSAAILAGAVYSIW